MEIQEIKSLLPAGSYNKIAIELELSYGTVAQFFAVGVKPRIAQVNQMRILDEAKSIIEDRAWRGLNLVHGEQITEDLKAALAA